MTINFPQISDDFNENFKSIFSTDYESNKVEFLKTPFFRKYFHQKIEEIKANKENFWWAIPYAHLRRTYKNISNISVIWSDVPVDYFREHNETINSMNFTRPKAKAAKWLRENMSYESFFNMVKVHSAKVANWSELDSVLNDTISQLDDIVDQPKLKLMKPKRWRLGEFHDHITELYVQKDIRNIEYENVHIPTAYVRKDGWSAVQPKDTTELAVWASKVRNCVRSYESKIVNDQSKIILIKENDVPKFTVEIGAEKEVTVASLNIKQAVGYCNKQLTKEERDFVTQLIVEAITSSAKENAKA